MRQTEKERNNSHPGGYNTGCDYVFAEEYRTVVVDADIWFEQIMSRHIWPLLMAV